MTIRPTGFLAVLVFLLFSTACGFTRIAPIASDPGRYRCRTVRVNGTVTNTFQALVAGLYEITDGTGRIYVLSSGEVPSRGARVRVTGRVVNGVTLAGHAYGPAIREREHKLR